MEVPPKDTARSGDWTVPNARAFVRSLNVLFKFSRLYGLAHARVEAQLEIAWHELLDAIRASEASSLLLGVSGSQLLLDGMPLESTSAERSLTQLLNAAGVASVCFYPNVERDEFITLVKAFTEPSSKTPALADRLEHYFGKDSGAGIRVNEIRFVAEDSPGSSLPPNEMPNYRPSSAPLS